MRKKKDDTPVGGWLGPSSIDDRDPTNLPASQRPSLRYAASSRNGKWVWKDIEDGYEKALAKMLREQQPKKKKGSRVRRSA